MSEDLNYVGPYVANRKRVLGSRVRLGVGTPNQAASDLIEKMGPEWCRALVDEMAVVVDEVHPCPVPGARPGELIAAGPTYRWLAYDTADGIAAACYFEGSLLRRDLAGWWTAGPRGDRRPVPEAAVEALVGTVPDEWPVIDFQAPLLGSEAVVRSAEVAA